MTDKPRLLAYYPGSSIPDYLKNALSVLIGMGYTIRTSDQDRAVGETQIRTVRRMQQWVNEGYCLLLLPQNGTYNYVADYHYEVRLLFGTLANHNKNNRIHIMRLEELLETVPNTHEGMIHFSNFDKWLMKKAADLKGIKLWSTNPMKRP
jgi:hypothetical protein